MSISAAMYAAVTGLSALSTGMQVISNNIANVNTVGFKAARTNFEDLISQDYWSNGKINQIGRGVKVSTVQQMFTQGSFMNSAQDTDMAITGEGFFQVRDRVTNELMYTRAGNFTFDADGYLETPAGYILQGWQLSVAKPGEDPVRLGAPTDIKVIAINAPPVETSQIKVVVNLNSEDEPAYLYSASAWATAYAHQIADGPAQIAKQDAIDAVYNVTIHGSAYPNTSTAFNNAYRTFMLQQGFVENPLGVFQKQVTESPTADEINDATSSAYASAMQLMGIVGTTYPIASNSPEYTKAFNDAYVAKMNGMGYQLSAGTTPVFKRVDAANQAYYDMAHINASAAAASDPDYFTGYTYGTYPDLDAIYINAYKAYMDSYGFTESTPGLPTYGNDPTPSEITAAETASADTTYTTPYQKHKAYNETLITLGYTVYPPFVDDGVTILDRTYFKPVTAAQLASSQAGAHNEGSAYAHAITNCPTDYTYPSGEAAYDNAYVAGYTSYMASQGFTGTQPAIPNYYKVSKAGTDEEDLALGEAQTAALLNLQPISNYPSTSNNPLYKILFDDKYKEYMTNLGYSTTVNSVPPYFQKTYMRSPDTGEDNAAKAAAIVMAEQEAEVAGQLAYTKTYDPIYQATLATITQKYAEWQLEGNGYAGAWDGTDLTSPIDPENYTHSNPWVIYDSLGAAHTLTVYYQPNPYEENVWDYIITCDPSEDARKDPTTGYVYMNGASFTGLIQKGKITFSAEGPDRHGGVIMDIEAQNIDSANTHAAVLTKIVTSAYNLVTGHSVTSAVIGGYFTGTAAFSASTGTMVDNPREYKLLYQDTIPGSNSPGFVWTVTSGSDLGNSGTFLISDKNYTGPYSFGSGLNVSFAEGGKPMSFTSGDTITLTAHAEQIGWTNLTPNEAGFFDFDVAFVQSASMALHPPYESNLPTVVQHIALDMGARKPNNQGDWILDEQSTTQYASKSINILSSQDGYPAGSLQRVSIGSDGILTGIYTNGRHQALYEIGLARFVNPWGLAKLGDNVYMETRWSGTVSFNAPGYGGTGTIRANFLEQSNTDLADEIVNMIVTQRGFQANSKVVTTTDTMLAEVIEMKR